MPSLVVPFSGAKGKSRLAPLPERARVDLAGAMLADVLDACVAVGPTFVVAPAGVEDARVRLVDDHGHGQGAAVRAGLAAAALLSGGVGPFLVVNADRPCVTARDLLALAGAIPEQGLALVAAADGTTNALGLSSPEQFVPVYGPGSAARFAALPGARAVEVPNLLDDVDTLADLDRVRACAGTHTRRVVSSLRLGAAA
jgi:2-phospho-L-lactate guanylyltransferase (CobY/MobA/RfbA family)